MTGISPLQMGDDFMKVSKNELTSLLKQAFEGCGFSVGAYETAANLVIWCKTHGFDISSALTPEKIAGFFEQNEWTVSLIEDAPESLIADFGGGSYIASGVNLSELVYAKSISSGFCVGKFTDCKDRKLVAKSVADFGKRGLHSIAFWRDNEEPNLINVARTVDGQCCPEYARYRTSELDEQRTLTLDETSLFIVCAKDPTALQKYLELVCAEVTGKSFQRWLPAGIKANYRSTLMDGIDINADLWCLLGEYRDKVLVESTEQSRMGAGA